MKNFIFICCNVLLISSAQGKETLGAWTKDGKILPASCFTVVWQSQKNFQAIEKKFGFKFKTKTRMNVGDYLGREIKSYDPIFPWEPGQPVAVIQKINTCKAGDKYNQFEVFILSDLELDFCAKLIANLKVKLTICREVLVENPLEGITRYGIFAQGEVDAFGPSIIPLRYFESKVELKKFTEGQRVTKNP